MNESNISESLYREYHQFNRNLTYFIVALVSVAALIIWFMDIDLGGKRASLMGIIFMVLAYFTYQIPYIGYQYLKYKYKNESEKRTALGYDWRQFRDLAMLRR